MELKKPFANVLPILSTEEMESLRADIAVRGVQHKCLATEDGRLLDGHTRLSIDPAAPVEIVAGSGGWSDEECLAFIFRTNRSRRNLSPTQRAEIRRREIQTAVGLRMKDPKRFTEEALAGLFGVSQQAVNQWFTSNTSDCNACVPTPDARVKVAKEHYDVIYDRVQDGETQEQIASDYGVTQQTISGIVSKVERDRARLGEWSEREQQLKDSLLAGKTVVVNIGKDGDVNLIEWAEEQGLFVLVDRRSEWGNPFILGDDGERDDVIRKFANHYLPHKIKLHREINSLKGKALGCHCAPLPCHGDILADLAERS